MTDTIHWPPFEETSDDIINQASGEDIIASWRELVRKR